jgi:hypothetical protein
VIPARRPPALFLLLMIGLVLPVQAALYRWIDEEGCVHYADVIPPASVRQGHTELRKDGIPIHTVPPARTPEQIRADEKLERLRAGQERILDQQRMADRGLLHTFPSENELIGANANQIAAIETMIQVTYNNIRRQEAWLAGLRTYAGNIERAGKPVPEEFTISSRKTERSIQRALASITAREAQKASIQARLDRDLGRYRQFSVSGRSEALSTSKRHVDRYSAVPCRTKAACDQLWNQALDYLAGRRELEILVGDSEDLLIAAPRLDRPSEPITLSTPPPQEREADLVLTRVPDDKGPAATLFLELRCEAAALGTPNCLRPDLLHAIQGFGAALIK